MTTAVFLTQQQLSERWYLSPRILERWRWEGAGPPHVKIGGRILYKLTDIEAYEQKELRLAPVKTGELQG